LWDGIRKGTGGKSNLVASKSCTNVVSAPPQGWTSPRKSLAGGKVSDPCGENKGRSGKGRGCPAAESCRRFKTVRM